MSRSLHLLSLGAVILGLTLTSTSNVWADDDRHRGWRQSNGQHQSSHSYDRHLDNHYKYGLHRNKHHDSDKRYYRPRYEKHLYDQRHHKPHRRDHSLHGYRQHRNNNHDERLLFGILVGGLIGYAIGNADTGHGFNYDD